jgi:hypothetical protein
MELIFCGRVNASSEFVCKIDYILCLAEYQILPDTFGAVECVAEVEIVKKLADKKDSHKCIRCVNGYYIYFGKKISNNNTLLKMPPCL